jgi:hypothetical protein
MPEKLTLITGGLQLLDPDGPAIDVLRHAVETKWREAVGKHPADVYVLGGLFHSEADPETADRILKGLPGRKWLLTEANASAQAQLPGWYAVTNELALVRGDTSLRLSDSPQTLTLGRISVHPDATASDTPTCVCGGWGRWGRSYGLVNVHYLLAYAKNLGGGFMEG